MKLTDISFIIISRNEEYALEKCLTSITALDLSDCEVVCVDSGSSDNTLGVMVNFSKIIDNMSVFRIDGESNAAVARNIGIKNASKNIIFFVDGDVEVEGLFIKEALRYISEGKCSAVTGRLEEYQYANGFKSLKNKIIDRYNVKKVGRKYFSGGIFVCKRSLIKEVGLFDEALTKSQDIDYTLRLTTHHTMFEIPVSMGIHHTIPYENTGRIIDSLRNQHAAYLGRCIRKNTPNIRGILDLLLSNSGHTIGLLFYAMFIPLFFIFNALWPIIFLIPVFDIVYGIIREKNVVYRIISHYIFPLFIYKGFILFSNILPVYSVSTIDNSPNQDQST